jgi:hypothetical protein
MSEPIRPRFFFYIAYRAYIGSAISIETPPVDCQFDNAANVFSYFLTIPIIANLDFC